MNDEVQRSLGRIEGQLSSLVTLVSEHLQDDDRRFAELKVADHALHERTSKIENKLSYWSGKIAILSAGVVLIADEFIRRFLRGE
jgi:hypothetical protein